MLKFLQENPDTAAQLLELLEYGLVALLVAIFLLCARLLGVRPSESTVASAEKIAKNVAGYAEEWGRTHLISAGTKPPSDEKLMVAIAEAKKMATGAMKRWSEEQWATWIRGQLPELRVKLSNPPPVNVSIVPPPPAPVGLPPVSPELAQLTTRYPQQR